MEDIAAKTLLELVESIYGMRRVGIGSNAKHIVFEAFMSLGYLHSPPLQGIGGHHVACHSFPQCESDVVSYYVHDNNAFLLNSNLFCKDSHFASPKQTINYN